MMPRLSPSLATVDTVLSKIPIAGYILTGKDKAFLSFVYEVKGDLMIQRSRQSPLRAWERGLWNHKWFLKHPSGPSKLRLRRKVVIVNFSHGKFTLDNYNMLV
jgi:hypothetical protein